MYLINPPRLKANITSNRDYAQMLQKTRLVYDQLVQQKAAKLMKRLQQEKDVFDRKCSELDESDPDKALEFAVQAQEKLTAMQRRAEEFLVSLYDDYQWKFNRMHKELETEWLQKHKASK